MITKLGINREEWKIAKAEGENRVVFHNTFHLRLSVKSFAFIMARRDLSLPRRSLGRFVA